MHVERSSADPDLMPGCYRHLTIGLTREEADALGWTATGPPEAVLEEIRRRLLALVYEMRGRGAGPPELVISDPYDQIPDPEFPREGLDRWRRDYEAPGPKDNAP